MSNYRQFRELEARGIDLVELLGGDRPLDTEEFRQVVNTVQSAGDELYVDLLFLLTNRRFQAEEAQQLWRGILRHKRRLAAKLGRDPGVRLSALDYLHNVRRILANPRLLDRSDLDAVLDSLHTDDLTGLFNRRHIKSTYQLELRRARRYGKHLSLMLIDVDDFKSVNDRFGHAAGDEVLVAVSKLLTEVCRETDTIGRYGGDEMVALLPETSKQDAWVLAERICQAAREREVVPSFRPETRLRVSLSIGVATYPEDSQESAELLRLADAALYASKERGKDAVSLAPPTTSRIDVREPRGATRAGSEHPRGEAG